MLYHGLEQLRETTTDREDRVMIVLALAAAIIVLSLWLMIQAEGGEIGRGGDDRAAPATVVPKHAPRHRQHGRTSQRAKFSRQANSVSLAGIVPPLRAKAQEIVASCRSRVVSSIRRGARVYGGNRSNHATGRAVDLTGNPQCIYALLVGWPGGVSTDYASAPRGPHVHVSYNPQGMEWGLRFKHRRR